MKFTLSSKLCSSYIYNTGLKALCLSILLIGFSCQKAKSFPIDFQQIHGIRFDRTKDDSLIYIGLSKMRELKYAEALALFNSAVNYNPKNWNAYKYRGLANLALKLYKEAEDDLSTALSFNEDDTTCYQLRAEAYLYDGTYNLAIADYNIAITMDSTDLLVYYGRGKCYYKMNEFQKSISDFNHYIKLGGDDLSAFKMRGEDYYQLYSKKKPAYADSAIKDLNRAILAFPNKPSSYALLGLVYTELNDSLAARKNFEQAIRLDSFMDTNATLLWANSEVSFNNYKNALTLFQKAKGYLFFQANDYYHYGLSLWGAKRDTIGALENFEKAQKLDSTILNLYRHKFELIFCASKFSKISIENLTRWMKLYKNQKLVGDLYAARSLAWAQMGNFNNAILDIEKAIELNPMEPNNYLLRGFLKLMTKENNKSVLKNYDKAINLNPKFAQSYLMLAYFYRNTKNLKKACQNVLKAEHLGFNVTDELKGYFCQGESIMKKDNEIQFVFYPYLKNKIMFPYGK